MQLTKLEIKGFKSFGDKITLHFKEGVTAIVGPNGCGKSNVVDAIRWVLGEQSTKMLRSEKMENIIFNGTKNRKPSNLAEVSLTFDNTKNILPTEFTQVTITRKLYRTGESEYRLNDVKCRLKDITDLFLDTGIGADSYSIIELKMIDEIINNKDHSRRSLFEEASGISKYKIRKRQSLIKLKDTQADLDRVEDLVFEIEKNLKSLENQAKKAERYFKLKEQYKIVSISLAKVNISRLQEKFVEIDSKKSQINENLSVANQLIENTEIKIQELKKENLLIEKNLQTQQKVTQEHLNKIRSYESEKKVKNETLRNLHDLENRLQQEINQDKQQINHVHYNLKRLAEEFEVENQKVEEFQNLINKLKTEISDITEQQNVFKRKLDESQRESQKIQQEIFAQEKELAVLKIQKESLTQESLRNREDSEIKEVELKEFNEALEQLTAKLDAHTSEYEKLLEEDRINDEQIKILSERSTTLNEILNKESRVRDAKQNEYNLTKSLVDNLEGFPESIRFLRKNAQWKKPYPLFSDILFCDEKYRVVIENFLEPYMNHYVVDYISEAIYALNLLSESARGRAHFFIIEEVNQYFDAHKKSDIQVNNPDLIPALSIISVEGKYEKLCKILLENVFIIENDKLDENFELPDKSIIILHKSGKFIKNKLGISGGSIGLFEGKRIGRAKNLENLHAEIKAHDEQIKKNENELLELHIRWEQLKKNNQKDQIEEYTRLINRLNSEHIGLKTKKEQYEAFIISNKNRKESINEKLEEIGNRFSQIEPEIDQLNLKKSELNVVVKELQEEYIFISEELSQLNKQFNEENLRFHQQQNRVKTIEKDIEYRESQNDTFEKRLTKNQEELKETQLKISETLQHVDHSDEDLLEMYETKTSLEQGLLDIEKEFQTKRNEIQEQEDLIQNYRKNKNLLDENFQAIKDEENQIKIELNTLKERLSIEFNLNIREFIEEEVEIEEDSQNQNSEPEEVIREKSLKFKKQLDEFGSINPMAMEAYNEMNERYQFILKEKSDLLEAKASLLETIEEIDEIAKEKFMESFNKVREHFIKVFRSLFNSEDNCDLILTQPDNPLESDIDILARPKGKRPLSINQLSGGEKTLTATALLFSLYLLKPAPFCIFDEVDAPLDDTNIDKFNNIIREFSKDSQFIIVSHNKRTIASTDIIYGVTMIEAGVSKVVAVDLRDVA